MRKLTLILGALCLFEASFLHAASGSGGSSDATLTSDPDAAVFVGNTITYSFSAGCSKQVKIKIYDDTGMLLADSGWQTGSVSLAYAPSTPGDKLHGKGYIETDSGDPDAEKLADVVKLVLSELWWFNGCAPANYAVTKDVIAAGGETGATFDWSIQAGTALDFGDGDTSEETTTIYATLNSVGSSGSINDQQVQLVYKGSTGTVNTTVRTPSWVTHEDQGSVAYNGGYKTTYVMTMFDQFGVELPENVPVNEDFDSWSNDYTGCNWPDGKTGSDMSEGSKFKDYYIMMGGRFAVSFGIVPLPVSPSDPNAGVLAQHATQRYYVGSLTPAAGVLVDTHLVYMFRGHGQQY